MECDYSSPTIYEDFHPRTSRLLEKEHHAASVQLKKYSGMEIYEKIEMLTFTNAPNLYTASARFVVAFPLEYSPKVYQSVDRQ